MATATDICNIGLSHIGARAQVASVSPPDGSVEAGYCARFYPIARREMLEAFNWSFAAKRQALSQVTNPSTVWPYAYALPSDYIKARRVLPLAVAEAFALSIDRHQVVYPEGLIDTIFTERGSTRFEIEGTVLYTHEPDAILLYTREVTDTNTFSPGFVVGMGMLMAGYLAGPIIKGKAGADAAVAWRQAAMNYAATAAAANANASSDRANDFTPSLLAARA
jgi:hypothetical protein